jgi:undecaprenyl-diphosphatase
LQQLIEGMNALDRSWLLALSDRQAPGWLDRTLRLITHLGGFAATAAISLGLLIIPGTRQVGLAMTMANAVSHLVVQILKRSVVRPRPDINGVLALTLNPDAFSFPSGHACAAMTLAVTAICDNPVSGLPALGLAFLVGASRVYLRVHYVTDVVVGQLVGAATAALVSVALL